MVRSPETVSALVAWAEERGQYGGDRYQLASAVLCIRDRY
jgi:hypothetical protein